jgi:hypothetical protein
MSYSREQSPFAWLGWLVTQILVLGVVFGFLVAFTVWALAVQPWILVFAALVLLVSYLSFKASDF